MDWTPIVQTLSGGVVAIAAGLVVAMFNRRTTRKDRDAEQVRRAAAELLSASTELWSAEQAVHMAVFTMVNVDRRSDAGKEERAAANEARLSAMAAHSAALKRAQSAANDLWLVSPELKGAADALIAACHMARPDPLPTPEEREQFDSARVKLVEAVRGGLKR